MIDPEQRRQDFITACQLLGGQRATALVLAVSERMVRNMVKGSYHIHDGFMGDIAAALIQHATACRDLAKRTDPFFTANRSAPPPRGGASHKRENVNG